MSEQALLSLAGFDPTGGAGVTLDLRVFSSQGFQGLGLCAALTLQNTREFPEYQCTKSKFVRAQYRLLKQDIPIRGFKAGMLGCREHISTVSAILDDLAEVPVVIDPVLRSSTGTQLLESESWPEYLNTLAGRTTLITPNLQEASLLTGLEVSDVEGMRGAASHLFAEYGLPSLIKGGHLPGRVVDLLFDGEREFVFEKSRLPVSAHGTGCFLSAHILCFLAKGDPLSQACRRAGEKTEQAIRRAVQLGRGQKLLVI